MRSHAKASSVGSSSGQVRRRPGALLAALLCCLCAGACLLTSSALAAETRPLAESFGTGGTGASSFERPGPLAFDQGNEHLYVFEQETAKVHGFDASTPGVHTLLGGNFPLSVEGGGEVPDLAVDSASHDFYYLSEAAGSLYAFDASGNAQAGNFPLGGFGFPCGAAVDPSGNVWVAEYAGQAVKEYDSAGNPIGSVSTSAQGNPCHIALDSEANLYVSIYEGSVWRYSAASGYSSATKVDPAVGAPPLASAPIAVERSTDDLYVVHPGHVSVYDSSGAPLYEFGQTVPDAEFSGIAIDEAGDEVYASDLAHSKVQVFGPAVPLPSVVTEDADGIATTTATLHGAVNPEGKALTDCHFDLVPAAQFATDEYESVTPAEEYPCTPAAASILPDSTSHVVKAEISGLSANTTYHFRLVAGTSEGTAKANDRTLTTAISAPTIAAESAEAIGTTDAILSAKVNPKGAPTTYHLEYGTTSSYGQSSAESSPIGFAGENSNHSVSVHIGGLNPGTAYHFRFVATSLVGEAEGADTTFATYPSTSPTSGSCPNEEFRTGFGERLPDCRAYEQVTPVDKHGANAEGHVEIEQASSNGDRVTFYLTGGLPSSGGSSSLSAYVASRGPGGWSTDGLLPLLEPSLSATIVGWSEDLSTSLDKALATGGGTDFYLREGPGAYRLVASDPELTEARLGNFAADTSHLTFETSGPLLPGAAAGQSNLYDLNHGTLTLPGRIPVAPATSCDDSSGPACVFAPEGAFLNNEVTRRSSISRDGSEVYFIDRATKQLYVREDGTRTTQVSAPQKTNGSGPGGTDPLGPKPTEFREATPDGAHAYFTSPEELTNDANTGVGPAIGRANLDGTGANQSFVPLPAGAGGVAVDGAHIYWANTAAGTISRSNLDGTGVEQSFITGASKPQYVAVDGSHIYWTNAATGVNGAGTIGRANLNGTGVEQSFITGASNPQGIAIDGSFVYWANAGSTEATRAIGRANLDGTSPEQSFIPVTEGTFGPTGVAVNSSFIYWGNPRKGGENGEGSIGRATIAGASPQQVFVNGASVPRGLALEGSYLYWANNAQGFGPAIARVKLDGSEKNRNFIHAAAAPQGLALDGSHLYWAADDARDTGNDLYRYDSATGDLADLSADSNSEDPKGAEVRQFLGASADGSYAYLLANGVLAPGAQPGEVESGVEVNGGFPRSPTNLYVNHAGTIKFVAPFEGVEVSGGSSRIADDGTLVFASERVLDLSGHDHGSCAGGGCIEFYRYSPADEGLACITCNPTGPPSNSVQLSSGPGSFLGQAPNTRTIARNLSADGKSFFFETSDALLPSDTNGVLDVYEWEAKGSGSCESESQNGGCLYLISSGTSPGASHLIDASSSGDDAFFFTEQQLVPADGDELVDVYDASVGGGLASQHQLTPPTCASTACQANPAPPPDPSTASSSYRGAGNVHKAPSARRCPKGKRRVRSKGKVRCQKAAKQHKRHSNRGGSK